MGFIKHIQSAFISMLTLGREHQSFLGAWWIPVSLRLCPLKYKRMFVLWILSLSPHYFYRSMRKDYEQMSLGDFLECEYQRNVDSRKEIVEKLLLSHLKSSMVAVDYGCGLYTRPFGAGMPESSFLFFDTEKARRTKKVVKYNRRFGISFPYLSYDFYCTHATYNLPACLKEAGLSWFFGAVPFLI